DAERSRRLRVSADGREAVVRARNQYAVGLLEQVIKRVGHLLPLGETRKQRLGECDCLSDEWRAAARADARDADDPRAIVKAQGSALLAVRFCQACRRVPAVREQRGAGLIEHVEE